MSEPVNNAAQNAATTTDNSIPANQSEPKKERQLIDLGEEKVDLEQLKRDYKKFKGADNKFREAATMRQEVERFYETLLNNPEEILNDPRIPLKKRELAEKWLMEQLGAELQEPEDPKDKKLSEMEKKLKKYEEAENEAKTKKEQEEYQSLVNQRKEAIANTLNKAMELSPLSKDPEVAAETLKEMVAYMRMTKQAGYEASPEEIAQHVEQKSMNKFIALVGRLDGDDLLSFADRIGLTAKVRKADLNRLTKSRQAEQPEVVEDWQPSNSGKKREVLDPDQLRRMKR